MHQNQQPPQRTIQDILRDERPDELRHLFAFDKSTAPVTVMRKFRLWSRYFFPKYFIDKQTGLGIKDAPEHDGMDLNTIRVYQGDAEAFLNMGYRGLAKTTRTKLFITFAITCDTSHFRKSMKILSEDGANSKQSVTDIYNMLIHPRIAAVWPEVFQKTNQKREETMSAFTTSTGIKVVAGTVGMSQRGDLQEESRPDFVWFDDFENRIILRSAVKLKTIWDNMEEAKDGLAKGGGRLYTANYLSERGNVHKLVGKEGPGFLVQNVPIRTDDGEPTWKARYTREDIQKIEQSADDFPGEFLGKPSASKDVIFDRARIDAMAIKMPIAEYAGMRVYAKYDPLHRYGAGADIAGGVGLDSSSTVVIDFSTVPAQVVAAYDDNTIHPEAFGQLMAQQGSYFGNCIIAPENNRFDAAIGRLKLIYPQDRIYRQEAREIKVENGVMMRREFGWNTNVVTKHTMYSSLAQAIAAGLLVLNDKRLIADVRSFTLNDLMDPDVDPRLTTRHFDLLTALAIAWQMNRHAIVYAPQTPQEEQRAALDEAPELMFPDIGL
jgi:hypothetical protein